MPPQPPAEPEVQPEAEPEADTPAPELDELAGTHVDALGTRWVTSEATLKEHPPAE